MFQPFAIYTLIKNNAFLFLKRFFLTEVFFFLQLLTYSLRCFNIIDPTSSNIITACLNCREMLAHYTYGITMINYQKITSIYGFTIYFINNLFFLIRKIICNT